MVVVKYFENKNLLLSQLRKSVPAVGDDIIIKGRKAKVSSINCVDEQNCDVQVVREVVVNKNKLLLDNSKKKRR
ncbi:MULTISPECIES: hypothetical protein [unclassified Bacillus (in: firmicutes)]|uniref:hypothetical protein n=1 Tax=unclassified Bacillus (in: firmicutes) TaxID=185979 RepID=UPI0008F0F88A|nr:MULTISPECIES: hypothetical protein [unclassified Bacillus (in: firmicutes)]SFB03897.1 hypothetical protein SAMN02799634_104240 [Bacillus sp. UNCCL13]SFQ88655.1 hypothetical protein SAMN04488577_3273 [Bacillus sp. cl95]